MMTGPEVHAVLAAHLVDQHGLEDADAQLAATEKLGRR